MLNRVLLLSGLFGMTVIPTAAFASAICTLGMIYENQEAPSFFTTTVPDNAGISTETTNNGFTFKIDCDLSGEQHSLTLGIVGPNGDSASTSNKNVLKLVDQDGNGAVARCMFQ